MTRHALISVCAVGLLSTASSGAVQSEVALARQLAPPASSATMEVTSPAFQANQPIPDPYGQEGDRLSPPIEWKGAPAGTLSLALLIEDPDAKEPKPFVHWSIYNLPPQTTRLSESVPALPQLPALGRAHQGRNSRGTIGYVGPRPPVGDPPHHYHVQVFSLDAVLSVGPGADRVTLLAAMKGHVLASGEVVGTFQRR